MKSISSQLENTNNPKSEHFYLILLLILAAAVRIFHLGYFSMWFDEAASFLLAQLSIPKIVELAKIDNTPPVYHTFLHLWLKTGVTSDFMVKLPAMIFGLGAVFMTYRLGRLIFPPSTALLAALLETLSFSQVHYSQENRMYSLQILLTLISTYFFLQALRQNKRLYWCIWLFSNVILYYNHLFAVFLFVAQWIYYLINWKKHRSLWRDWLLFNLLLIVSLIPWLPVILRQMNAIQETYWVLPATPKEILKVAIFLTGGTDLGDKFILTGILHLPFIIGFITGLVSLVKDKEREKLFFPVLFFTPLIVVYLISIGRQSLFFGRYFVFLVPFLHLIIAYGVFSTFRGRIRTIIMAFLVVSSFVFLNGYYTISQYSEPQRQPTRDLFRFLQGKAKIGDVVIYQAVQNAGLEPYFVSLRYNYNRFQLYIWRDNPLPFYYGKQIFTPGRNLTTLQSFSSLSKIWVVSPHFSNILNSDGLPVQPNKWSHKIEYHSIIPEDLWKELAQYRFRLETKVCFGNLHLYEFIKRNQE